MFGEGIEEDRSRGPANIGPALDAALDTLTSLALFAACKAADSREEVDQLLDAIQFKLECRGLDTAPYVLQPLRDAAANYFE